MKKLLLILALVPGAVAGQHPKKEYRQITLDEKTSAEVTAVMREEIDEDCAPIKYLMTPEPRDGEFLTELTVTTTKPGELADLIGDKLMTVKSIRVNGPINDADFNTLWESTFYGNVTFIHLLEAKPVDDIIPQDAFYHNSVQNDNGWVYTISLEKLILPEGIIKSIGRRCCYMASELEYLQFPYAVESIGDWSFYQTKLKLDDKVGLILPYDLKVVKSNAFRDCYYQGGELYFFTMPETIEQSAFFYNSFTKVWLRGGLKTIGMLAFAGNKFTSINLPATFDGSTGMSQFASCMELKNVYASEGISELSEEMFSSCISLEKVYLPSTLQKIGNSCFMSTRLKEVYCAAVVPPVCDFTHDVSPFRGLNLNLATLFVPKGTKELYRMAKGWSDFENIVETESFPTEFDDTGVDTVADDAIEESDACYDLQGRRVANPSEGSIYIRNGKKVIHRQ